VLGRTSGAVESRLGLAISRKVARHAVQRNRLKRIAREVFRHRRGALTGLDLVVLAKSAAVTASNAELRQSLEQHCEGLPNRCAGS
jgi:ribonuclease P protein component